MRILLIAIYSPELNTSASIRTHYYIKYLSEMGYKIDLIIPRYPKDFINFDESRVLKYSNVDIHYTDLGILYKRGYAKKETLNNSGLNTGGKVNLKRRLIDFVKSSLLIPDVYFEFRRNAVTVAEQLLKEKKIDLIFTMHEPPSSHLIGRSLKKKNLNINWIAYWSDPWTFDPNRNLTFHRRIIEFAMQRDVIRLADAHFFTSELTKQHFKNAYKNVELKADIVLRGYEIELIESTIPIKMSKEKVNVVYTGEVYTKIRDLSQLIKSLKIMEVEETEIFNKLVFYFIGGIDNPIIEKELRTFKNVRLIPRVSYKESIAYLKAADVMLLFGNNIGGQIPGKLYDYLGHSGPILTILGHENDQLKNFSVLSDKGIVIENNYNEIGFSIKEIVDRYNAKDFIEGWQKPAKEYEWSNVAADLGLKIEKAIGGK